MARLLGHLLLALCLLLNGIGSVAAAAAMPWEHANHAHPGCHDQAVSSTPAADNCLTPDPAPTGLDCCDPERCDGACVQHAVAAPEPMQAMGSDDLGLGYRPSAVPGYPNPVLPRAVRPPIA